MAKILLVEDDNNLREIYEARLLAEGYEIVSARDGEEALTVAMKERPDLIISDVMMPKISGFDMLDIIRSTEETKNAKVIMMTALSQAEDKERANKLGADRYLVKSQVTLEDVAKVAREVLAGEPVVNNYAASATTSAPAQDDPATATPTPTTPSATVNPSSAPNPAVAASPVNDQTQPLTPAQQSNDNPSATTTQATQQPATAPEPADEQTAIASQIQSDLKDAGQQTTANSGTPTSDAATSPTNTENMANSESTVNTSGSSNNKKVIEPINDPNAPTGPKLDELFEEEVKKEEIAKAAEKISTDPAVQEEVDEAKASAELLAAAQKVASDAHPDAPVASDTPTQLNITESGEIQQAADTATPTTAPNSTTPPPAPNSAAQQTSTPITVTEEMPVVEAPTPTSDQPSQEQQNSQETPAIDPNSIAL